MKDEAFLVKGFNRSIVELKVCIWMSSTGKRFCFNRSIVELKVKYLGERKGASGSFNRSIVELKEEEF